MVFGIVLGVVFTLIAGYFVNQGFRAEVQEELTKAQAEIAALKTKATSGTAIAESDFAKVETAVKNIFSKL